MNKDCEEDNGNGCRDELLLARHLALVENERERERHGASNTAVAHDEHVGEFELEQAPAVGQVGEYEHAEDAIDRAADERQEHKARIPRVMVGHGAQAHEHEDDRLHDAREHLEHVLDGGVGLLGYVELDVLLHEHAAEGDGQNARRAEHLGGEVGQVGVGEYDERLEDGRVLGELGGEAGDDAEYDADEDAADGHDEERADAESHVGALYVLGAHFGEGVEQPIEHHRDGVVEQRLAEHHYVQHVVDVYLDKGGQHGHRIDGRYERREHEAVQHVELGAAVQRREAGAPQRQADQHRVEERVGDGEEQYGADVVEERPCQTHKLRK